MDDPLSVHEVRRAAGIGLLIAAGLCSLVLLPVAYATAMEAAGGGQWHLIPLYASPMIGLCGSFLVLGTRALMQAARERERATLSREVEEAARERFGAGTVRGPREGVQADRRGMQDRPA
jgi:hypothetical protein